MISIIVGLFNDTYIYNLLQESIVCLLDTKRYLFLKLSVYVTCQLKEIHRAQETDEKVTQKIHHITRWDLDSCERLKHNFLMNMFSTLYLKKSFFGAQITNFRVLN